VADTNHFFDPWVCSIKLSIEAEFGKQPTDQHPIVSIPVGSEHPFFLAKSRSNPTTATLMFR